MSYARHILSQGPVLAALGRAALGELVAGPARGDAAAADHAGRTLTAEVPARSPALVRDYVRVVGGNPGAYRDRLPAHMFPQWGFPLLSRLLEGLPYPMRRVLNAGCRMEIHRPLPQGEPLQLIASLEKVDETERRVVLQQRLVTGTPSAPGALVADLFALVPLRPATPAEKEARPAPPRVSEASREVGRWRASARAGFEFACVTGDFNPIHWLPPAARMAGFPNVILHGFATLARTIESLNRNVWSGAVDRLAAIDVRLTRPLVLPADVGVFIDGEDLAVGEAPGGPAYLTGTYRAHEES